MKIHNKGAALLTIGVLAATIAVAPVEAAKKKVKEPAPPLPIVVTSDHMRYHDDTGDIIAEGNVVITQGTQKLSAAVVEGNSKSGDVHVDGRALYEVLGKDNIAITGGPVVYNWVQRKGSIEEPKGHIDDKLIHGESIELLPDKYVVHEGRVTRCTKEDNPHYCMIADRIEIIPGQKMTAYHVKVQLLGHTLYSQAKYTKSLRPGEEDEGALVPDVGYNSDNGAYVAQRFNYPLTEKVTAFADIGWYSRHGFAPYGGLRYRGEGYTAQLIEGKFYDGNGYKITKEPELQVTLDTRRIGSSAYHYAISASYGKWDDGSISSWHNEERIYVSRDPLYFNESKNLWLSLGAGTGYMSESYLGRGWQTRTYNAVLYKTWAKWQTDIGYHYNRDNRNLFNYGRSDRSDYWEENLFYQANAKDAVGVTVRYDVQANNVYDVNFTWKRKLNDCFQMEIIYKEKEQKLEYHIQTMRW